MYDYYQNNSNNYKPQYYMYRHSLDADFIALGFELGISLQSLIIRVEIAPSARCQHFASITHKVQFHSPDGTTIFFNTSYDHACTYRYCSPCRKMSE